MGGGCGGKGYVGPRSNYWDGACPPLPTPMYYEPENKAQSRQWVGPGSPRPKKFKTQLSAGKVMATVFWDSEGATVLDFLPKRSTITGVYYANLLDQLRTAIPEKRQEDNARVQLAKLQWMLQSETSIN